MRFLDRPYKGKPLRDWYREAWEQILEQRICPDLLMIPLGIIFIILFIYVFGFGHIA